MARGGFGEQTGVGRDAHETTLDERESKPGGRLSVADMCVCVQMRICVTLAEPNRRYFGKFLSPGRLGRFRKIFREMCARPKSQPRVGAIVRASRRKDRHTTWPRHRFLEIPLEIRPLGAKHDSGNFPGNLTPFGKQSRPSLLDLPLGTPQNLEMPLRASENLRFRVQKSRNHGKIARCAPPRRHQTRPISGLSPRQRQK